MGISIEVVIPDDKILRLQEPKMTDVQELEAIIFYKKQREDDLETRTNRSSRNSLFSSKKLS